MPTVVNQSQWGKDTQTQITLDAQTDHIPGKNWINMSLSYWRHADGTNIRTLNLIPGLKAKKNKQNALSGRQFQLFLSSKNAAGDVELSAPRYFLRAPASFLERGFCHPCLCETYNVTAQTRSLSGPPPAPPPPHSHAPTHPTHPPTHKLPQHQTRIPFAGRYGCVLQTMSAPPSLWPGWQLLCSGSSMRLTSVSAGLTMI